MFAAASKPAFPAPAGPKSVLVVDSGPAVNVMLHGVLAEGGWNIERAVDNKTALSLLKQHAFDLIITGQNTCSRADVELLREIRSVRPHVKMIILTDETTPGDVIDAVRSGAFSYVCPPYTRNTFADMVHLAMTQPAWDDGIEIVSATPSWVRLIVRCDLATAHRLVQFLRAGSTLPEEEKNDVVSAFHEILLNAMEHGGQFDPSQYVEVAFFRGRKVMICRVKDPGQGFSLDEARHAALDSPPEELLRQAEVRQGQGLRPGGLGVTLAGRFVDELVYSEQGNDVLLVKYLNLPPDKQAPPRQNSGMC